MVVATGMTQLALLNVVTLGAMRRLCWSSSLASVFCSCLASDGYVSLCEAQVIHNYAHQVAAKTYVAKCLAVVVATSASRLDF